MTPTEFALKLQQRLIENIDDELFFIAKKTRYSIMLTVTHNKLVIMQVQISTTALPEQCTEKALSDIVTTTRSLSQNHAWRNAERRNVSPGYVTVGI